MGGGHYLPAHGPGIPLTWSPSWTGTAGTWWPGDCPTLWRPASGRGPEPENARRVRHRPEPAPANAGGSQFTSREFTQILQDRGVKISMDGRGRYQDNILVERLWRTVKYEEVYLKAYANGLEARKGLREYFRFYNERRPHQALGLPYAGGGLPRRACRRESEGKEVLGPTSLGIMRRSAGVPLNCGLILSNRWGPPHCLVWCNYPVVKIPRRKT